MIPERYVMVLLCSICCLINYADRVNMSVAIIAIADEYDFSVEKQGTIMSYFFLGYLPMQLGGAVLCRRFGGKAVLTYGAFLWSMFTILTPLACKLGFYPLLLCRVLMGLSEGVAFPSVYHFLSGWIPANERGKAVSIFLTGVHIGTTLALVLSPVIIREHSWQLIFYSFGGAGLLWIVVWHLIAYDREGGGKQDEEVANRKQQVVGAGRHSEAEVMSLIKGGSSEGGKGGSSSRESFEGTGEDGLPVNTAASSFTLKQHGPGKWGVLGLVLTPGEVRSIRFILTSKKLMAVCLAQAIFGFIHYTILSWLPSYFKHVYGAKTTSLSFTFIPYLSMALSANMGGFMADHLIARGVPLGRARKMVTVGANIGAASTLVLATVAHSMATALVCISLSMACMSLNAGGFESAYLDNASPALVGIFKATANTMASFSGLVAIPFSTLVLKWSGNSWRFMFGSLSIWYVVKTGIFCSYYSSDRTLVEEAQANAEAR